MKPLIILTLAILTLVSCGVKTEESVLENPNWFLNGQPSPNSSSIDKLTNKIIPRLLKYKVKFNPEDTLTWWTVDTVGDFHGKIVIDLFYHIKKINWDSSGYYESAPLKAICIETSKNKYRLIYLPEGFSSEDRHEPSKVVTVDNTEILYTKITQSGMAQYAFHMFWEWDEEKDAPIEMDIKRGFQAVFKSESPNDNKPAYTILDSPELKCYDTWYYRFRSALPAKSFDSLIVNSISVTGSFNFNKNNKIDYTSKMDTIIYSRGYPIVEIGYEFECQSCRDSLGEIIAIQYGSDLYRPIHRERSIYNEENLVEPHLLFIDRDTVLIIDGRTKMIESYCDNFWVFSGDLEYPQPLYQYKVVETTLLNWADSVLEPDQNMITEEGYWDFNNLIYYTPVSYTE